MPQTSTRILVANDNEWYRDPISGAPGAHPLATGAGGWTGKEVAESADPFSNEAYWRENYQRERFYVKGKSYEYYAAAFRAGWQGRVQHDGRSFIAAEADLAAEYNSTKSELDPNWHDVRPAASAAWDRVERQRITAHSIEQVIHQHGR